jgi:hypothetical protein
VWIRDIHGLTVILMSRWRWGFAGNAGSGFRAAGAAGTGNGWDC